MSLLAYVGGTLALELSKLIVPAGGSEYSEIYFAAAAMAVFLVYIAAGILISLFLVALLAHAALVWIRKVSAVFYALVGAAVGLTVGVGLIGSVFDAAERGASCGVPVGALCGLLFWRIRRPDMEVTDASAPRLRPLDFSG